ncbi:Mor transcription activator family protein [Kineothrix alysoides]|uniref:Mor transcription activator family protein n=1 Tax=Kineothrix alysoides TaxID=1469948 RepID=A0A4R1QYC9_9FIRM|nr:CD3324 family protein [Kineothrix alysoides]TCL58044.1 Mor transcription activator family protein [Kineothrix alysoides]
MKYKNAQDILPDKLLKELQTYVSGETLYIPNTESKKQWGESSGARSYYKQRNAQIREKYMQGGTLEELAKEYNLSIDSIRKIIY